MQTPTLKNIFTIQQVGPSNCYSKSPDDYRLSAINYKTLT